MFNVVATPAEAQEEATGTRYVLAQRISKATYPEKPAPVPASDNTELHKALRKQGKELYMSKVEEILESFPSKEQLQGDFEEYDWWLDLDVLLEYKVEWVAAAAMLRAGYFRHQNEITSPYFIEGMFQGMRQYLFQQGKKAPFTLKYSKDPEVGVYKAATAPHNTSMRVDYIMFHLAEYRDVWYRGLEQADWGAYLISTTENDVALLHGFKSYADAAVFRWTSARAASVVKEITGSDETAKRAADELRNIFNYTYDLYPNDCDFGEVYDSFAGYVGSCMAGEQDSICVGGVHIHPCTAYSAAYHGSGDNGLVLIVAKVGEEIIGRGIMNANNNKIVRWYGEWKTYVQLSNILQVTEDSDAFEHSWLALLVQHDKDDDYGMFAHPYIDGGYDEGCIDWGFRRVVLYRSSDYNLADTDGYRYLNSEDLENA